MISSDNRPLNRQPSDADFTVNSYRELLVIAKQSYVFASYDAIPWGQRFVLWRHDCDYSLNRAHVLARVEAEESVYATYFLNPHCEFYNLYERGQYRLVQEILGMGHQIGLHFDASFHDIPDEESLATHIRSESVLLEALYGVKPSVFSFHNPVASHMRCEEEVYGGLVNCYSRRFKSEVPYCSDSNGYWRFRRLRDVLTQATDHCLQVLTHPGWWQENVMSPRQRIFRSVYGRAKATMQLYDSGLDAYGRENIAGAMEAVRFLKATDPKAFDLCDLLWNRGDFPALFLELWRVHEEHIKGFFRDFLRQHLHVAADQVEWFLGEINPSTDGLSLIEQVFGQSRRQIAGEFADVHETWLERRGQLMRGQALDDGVLEEGCVYLCSVIQAIVEWTNSERRVFDRAIHPDMTEEAAVQHQRPSGGRSLPVMSRDEWKRIARQAKTVGGAAGAPSGDAQCD